MVRVPSGAFLAKNMALGAIRPVFERSPWAGAVARVLVELVVVFEVEALRALVGVAALAVLTAQVARLADAGVVEVGYRAVREAGRVEEDEPGEALLADELVEARPAVGAARDAFVVTEDGVRAREVFVRAGGEARVLANAGG